MYYACQIIEGSWVLLNFASAVRITVPLVLDVKSRQCVSIWTGSCANSTLWRHVAKALRFNIRLDLDGLQAARQRWPAGWLPKYSQAEVTRAQFAIHGIHTFNSPSNCAKHCFLDPEHCRSTRDKAYDISTMKENMASSSEEAALRRLLLSLEDRKWTKTVTTAMFFLQPHIRCNFFVRPLRPINVH